MPILILQLGDIHLHSRNDWVLSQAAKIASATAAEVDSRVDRCCILLTGDAVQNGSQAEFSIATQFLRGIQEDLAARLNCTVDIITIPGNHDLDLSADQAARDQIIDGIASAAPLAQSILDIVLPPLANYFAFAADIGAPGCALTLTQPFFRTVRIASSDGTVDFNLVNTSWMCRRGQSPGDLYFPCDTFDLNADDPPTYSIAVLHHPLNWFNQPSTMRPLRDRLEHSSDIIISGHEHGHAAYAKLPLGSLGVLQYLEGGVLQERHDSSVSSFAVIFLDLLAEKQRIVRFSMNDEKLYIRQLGADTTPLRVNISRKDRRFQIASAFRGFLDDPDLPFADSKQRTIRLLDIFTYPDFREDVGLDLEPQWKRVKGVDILSTLLTRRRVLISGSPKSGKTSLAKSLFVDFLGNGKIPLYLNGAQLKSVITPTVARDAVSSALKYQYANGSVEAFEQCGDGKRVLSIDDINAIDDQTGGREALLEWIEPRFDLVIGLSDDEFAFEQMYSKRKSASKLVEYDFLRICEFGYLRIEDLARRWLIHCSAGPASEEHVRIVCKTVGRVLQINAIPHHPWVLIVLLQEATEGQEIAAKNGSYGHLFQAVVTSALYRSREHSVDIETKFVYLAELAYAMYSVDVAVFDDAQARRFHDLHCEKYDLELTYTQMVHDLAHVNILRIDGGRVAFRAKYSYWFFIAWHMARFMHESEISGTVLKLCDSLHHEDTANIFVFLAHLSNDPLVLRSIVSKARLLFDGSPLANLSEDVEGLNVLQREEFRIRLKAGDPDENRRLLMEEKDVSITERDSTATDGRRIQPVPTNDDTDGLTIYLRNLQASLKAIDILGQVLRNGAGSIPASEKREIVEEIYRLARRIVGLVLQDLPNQLQGWASSLWRRFEDRFPDDTVEIRLDRVISQVSHTLWFIIFSIVRRVSQSLAHEMLRKTFERVLADDLCVPNRVFDLAIKLDAGKGLPSNDAVRLFEDVSGNFLVRAVLKSLVVNHLSLHRVDFQERQSLCDKLGIESEERMLDPEIKKVRGELSSSPMNSRSAKREADRRRKKAERRRRRK